MMVGTVLATLYASANTWVPIAPTRTMSRANPVIRDTAVPSAIVPLDLSTLVSLIPPPAALVRPTRPAR
jgi:hypothetical protein